MFGDLQLLSQNNLWKFISNCVVVLRVLEGGWVWFGDTLCFPPS